MAGQLSNIQDEERQEASRRRDMMMNHYLTDVIPQYRSTKAKAADMRNNVRMLQQVYGYNENDATAAIMEAGGDVSAAREILMAGRAERNNPLDNSLQQTGLTGGGGGAPSQPSAGIPQPASPAPQGQPAQEQTQQHTRPMTQRPSFWDRTMGRQNWDQIHTQVVSDIAGLYGQDPGLIQQWIDSAYMSPESMLAPEFGPTTMRDPLTKQQENLINHLVTRVSDIDDPTLQIKAYSALNTAYNTGDIEPALPYLEGVMGLGERTYLVERIKHEFALDRQAHAAALSATEEEFDPGKHEVGQQRIAMEIALGGLEGVMITEHGVHIGSLRPEDRQRVAERLRRLAELQNMQKSAGRTISGMEVGSMLLDEVESQNIRHGHNPWGESSAGAGTGSGRRTSEGRQVIENPDGTVSTEETITVEIDGEYYNIPTIYGGQRVPEDLAIEVATQSGFVDPDTGRAMPSFKTLEEAEKAAQDRTESLGREQRSSSTMREQPRGREVTREPLPPEREQPAGMDDQALVNYYVERLVSMPTNSARMTYALENIPAELEAAVMEAMYDYLER